MLRGFHTLKFFPDPVTVPAIRGGTVEKYGEGDRFTATVAAAQAATGARFMDAVAGQDRQVQLGGAGSNVCVGLALHDAAAGEKVTIATEGVFLCRAGGAIVAGNRVILAAGGTIVAAGAAPDARQVVGIALADIANGQDGPILLAIG